MAAGGKWALVALLALQTPTLADDYRATVGGSELAMVTLIATYPDGSPVRGVIRCAGTWFKHADEQTVFFAPELPFQTDSRGAVIMNPHLDDEWIDCWCEANGYVGRVRVTFSGSHPTQIGHIRMRRES